MKIAVVGSGIFGVTVALKLARNDYAVDLFEKNDKILCAASSINQYRLHRGYHYPRSTATALLSKHSEGLFRAEYAEAIIDSGEHYYCIAKEGSKTSGEAFLDFCRECGLEYEHAEITHIRMDLVELVVKVREPLIDPLRLSEIAKNKIEKESKINLFLNRPFEPRMVDEYDVVINCAYSNLNFLYPKTRQNYQFEICEKPVLRLPKKFKDKSIVIMDGPFFCIDPYSDTNWHVMGNVVHAIHATNTGLFPEVPPEIVPLMNRGIIKNPPVTNIEKFLKAAKEFMPDIKDAEHIGSMYTTRTVLPGVDATDERPTLVTGVNGKIINVFSGKIGTCVQAAEEVLQLVGQ